MATEQNRERWVRYWNRHAGSYDRQMRRADQKFFGDTRSWACGQADGDTLEVAIGTGLNIPLYPEKVRLTGVDLSAVMLDGAQVRARGLGRDVRLCRADAHVLPFADAAFDTVVCTFSLCAIPDHVRAVREMARVLRPGGLLVLADHVAGARWPVRAVQWLMELGSVPIGGEHFLRRPLAQVEAEGFQVERQERFKLGIVERLTARKPG